MEKSISQQEYKIDENKKTAIIYSADELLFYIVEIRHKNKSYFIEEGNLPSKFDNLGDARNAAKQQAVEVAFLALSKTYQEVDKNSEQPKALSDRYDYMVLKL